MRRHPSDVTSPGKGGSVCPKEKPMSFKSREKKRRGRLARSGSRREQRSKYADRHYLTIVSRAACCNRCGGSLRDGAECVYRHKPREILCVFCADSEKIYHRPSLRWERQRRSMTRP
jgi:hypothetical protein